MMEIGELSTAKRADSERGGRSVLEGGTGTANCRRQPVEVFIAYEDLHTGLRSKATLNRVFKQLEESFESHVELCRFDMLRIPELSDWAAREARRSDVVVVSTHGDGQLPGEVVDWIHLWADQEESHGRALVASLDEKVRQTREVNGTLACLRKVAAETGLHLLCHFGRTPRQAWQFIVRCIRKRSEPTSEPDDDLADSGPAGSRWGINE